MNGTRRPYQPSERTSSRPATGLVSRARADERGESAALGQGLGSPRLPAEPDAERRGRGDPLLRAWGGGRGGRSPPPAGSAPGEGGGEGRGGPRDQRETLFA
jgi:hypothetical protein